MIYARKWPQYAKWWDTMNINASRRSEAERAAQYAIDNKAVYYEIERLTGVPWVLAACNHRRESDRLDKFGNPLFNCYMGNGQALWNKTTIVPIGRGPFCRHDASKEEMAKAFIAGAKDAYSIDKLDQVKDWCWEKIMFYEELFNGAGYDMRDLPAPYLWGGTNIQKPGKFVADHKFNKQTMDKQLGCAPIMYMIAKLDTTVVYLREH